MIFNKMVTEMDINCRIIEAVRGSACLHNPHASIGTRQREWRELANQMNLEERFIKNRWHCLRQNYRLAIKESLGNPVHFKYHNQMSFVLPQLLESIRKAEEAEERERQLPHNVIQPEFILHREDIERESDSEEYVFLEIETLEGNQEEEYQAVVYDPQQEQTPDDTIIFDPQNLCTLMKKENYPRLGCNGFGDAQQQQHEHLDGDIQQEVIVDVMEVETTANQLQRQLDQDSEQEDDIYGLPEMIVKDEKNEVTSIDNDSESIDNEFMLDSTLPTETVLITKQPTRSQVQTRQASKRRLCTVGVDRNEHSKLQRLHQMPLKAEDQYIDLDMDVANMYEEVVDGVPPTASFAHKTEIAAQAMPQSVSPASGDNERNEDRIFVELIAAMLVSMPTDKKRNIKREIMNLLLA